MLLNLCIFDSKKVINSADVLFGISLPLVSSIEIYSKYKNLRFIYESYSKLEFSKRSWTRFILRLKIYSGWALIKILVIAIREYFSALLENSYEPSVLSCERISLASSRDFIVRCNIFNIVKILASSFSFQFIFDSVILRTAVATRYFTGTFV